MSANFIGKLSLRYLRSARQEGFVSVIAGFSFLGIALGVATLVIVMAVMNGFREELLTRIVGMRGHIMVHGTQGELTNYSKLVDSIRSHPKVTSAFAVIERQAILTFHGQARGIAVQGIEPTDLKDRPLIADHLKSGSFENWQENGIFIGRRLADQLYIQTGDRVTLMSPNGQMTAFGAVPLQKTFTVQGVFEVGMHEYDKTVVFMPILTAQKFFKLTDAISDIEIFTNNIQEAGAIRAELDDTLMKLPPDQPLRVIDWQHSSSSYFQAVETERSVMFLILTLIIVIAAFNIISSLIMLVKDKTRDIAILRTMGATRSQIVCIFMSIGISIGLLGTLIGIGMGIAFALNIESIRQFLQTLSGTELFQAEIYFLSQLPAKVIWGEVGQVAMMSLGLSFLATIFPAWKAAKLDPVEALRM